MSGLVAPSAEGRSSKLPAFFRSALLGLMRGMKSPSSHLPLNPQHLAMIAEVSEAYAVAFSIRERDKLALLNETLATLVERGAHTKAELMALLELEIAKGLLRDPSGPTPAAR